MSTDMSNLVLAVAGTRADLDAALRELRTTREDAERVMADADRLTATMQEALTWLEECDPQIIEHNHGVPYDHIGITIEALRSALGAHAATTGAGT